MAAEDDVGGSVSSGGHAVSGPGMQALWSRLVVLPTEYMTIGQIAEALGIGRDTAEAHVRALFLPFKPLAVRLASYIDAHGYRDYVAAGLGEESAETVAARLGVPVDRVLRFLEIAALRPALPPEEATVLRPPRPRDAGAGPTVAGVRLTAQRRVDRQRRREAIRKLPTESMTIGEVAAALGAPYAVAAVDLRNLGLRHRRSGRGPNLSRAAYMDAGIGRLPDEAVAKALGVPAKRVRGYRRSLHLPPPPPAEARRPDPIGTRVVGRAGGFGLKLFSYEVYRENANGTLWARNPVVGCVLLREVGPGEYAEAMSVYGVAP